LIDSSGVVRFDSKISVDSLALVDNHRNRLEVRMALNEGFGTDQRLSSTLNEPFYYGALRIKHNYLPQTKGERFVSFASLCRSRKSNGSSKTCAARLSSPDWRHGC
jgi:hypothetical protein